MYKKIRQLEKAYKRLIILHLIERQARESGRIFSIDQFSECLASKTLKCVNWQDCDLGLDARDVAKCLVEYANKGWIKFFDNPEDYSYTNLADDYYMCVDGMELFCMGEVEFSELLTARVFATHRMNPKIGIIEPIKQNCCCNCQGIRNE